MQPGDCVAFNSRILHGGSGKLYKNTDLQFFTSKCLGDDARITFRECGIDPYHSAVMTERGLNTGDRQAPACTLKTVHGNQSSLVNVIF